MVWNGAGMIKSWHRYGQKERWILNRMYRGKRRKHPSDRITRVCLVYTSATSRLSLSVPSSRLSPSPVSLESRLTLSTSSRHIAFIYHFLTHPPITRTIGREESMEMGFIRPHPHRLFALESGRRSSSRPAFTPTYTTVVYLCTHVARGQYTRTKYHVTRSTGTRGKKKENSASLTFYTTRSRCSCCSKAIL
jgi:hypothetical protein